MRDQAIIRRSVFQSVMAALITLPNARARVQRLLNSLGTGKRSPYLIADEPGLRAEITIPEQKKRQFAARHKFSNNVTTKNAGRKKAK